MKGKRRRDISPRPGTKGMAPPRTLWKEKPRGRVAAAVVVQNEVAARRNSTAVVFLVCGVLSLLAVESNGEECYCDRQGPPRARTRTP